MRSSRLCPSDCSLTLEEEDEGKSVTEREKKREDGENVTSKCSIVCDLCQILRCRWQ